MSAMPARAAPAMQPGPAGEFTQAGDAERFACDFQHAIRYVHGWGEWHLWTVPGDSILGGRWAPDRRRSVHGLVKESLRDLAQRAAAAPDAEYRRILRHVESGLRAPYIEGVLSLASSDRLVSAHVDDLDRDEMLLNVINGTIDLATGTIRPAERGDLITKLAPVVYDPRATCPRWDAFLSWVFCGSADLQAYVQRAVGYALTGSVKEQAWFFLHGNGANGKTTFLEVIEHLLGDYARRAMPDLLLAKGGFGSHPTELAALQGARFVTANEPDQGVHIREGLLKAITGETTITARRMRRDPIEFPATFKLFLAANHLPPTTDLSQGFWRRVKLIPFRAQVSEAERDPSLQEKLREEMPGILRWAVEGCQEWHRHGLGAAPEVVAATRDYREEQDQLRRFVEDECVLSTEAWAITTGLYKAFSEWCQRNGESKPSRLDFTSQLQRIDGVQKADRGYGRGFKGIGLKAPAPEAVTR